MHQEARDVDNSSENCMGGATRPRAPGLVLVASRRSRARSAPDLAPAGSRQAPARMLERPHAARHRSQPRRRVRRGVKAVLAALTLVRVEHWAAATPDRSRLCACPAVRHPASRARVLHHRAPRARGALRRGRSPAEAGHWCARWRTPSRTMPTTRVNGGPRRAGAREGRRAEIRHSPVAVREACARAHVTLFQECATMGQPACVP